jgi:hypothetical protein
MAKPAAPKTETDVVVGKAKLAYFLTGSQVKIVLHTADAKGEIGPADKVNELVVDAADLPLDFKDGDVMKKLAGYGLLKLLQDRTSQISSSTADKFSGMVAEAQRLANADEAGFGEWKAKTVRAESSTVRSNKKVDTFLAQAIVEHKGITLAAATSALKALSKEDVAKLAANESIKAIVERLKAEGSADQASGTDLADLLG